MNANRNGQDRPQGEIPPQGFMHSTPTPWTAQGFAGWSPPRTYGVPPEFGSSKGEYRLDSPALTYILSGYTRGIPLQVGGALAKEEA